MDRYERFLESLAARAPTRFATPIRFGGAAGDLAR